MEQVNYSNYVYIDAGCGVHPNVGLNIANEAYILHGDRTITRTIKKPDYEARIKKTKRYETFIGFGGWRFNIDFSSDKGDSKLILLLRIPDEHLFN